MLAEISNRCDKVEECYEFLLAYAAQGLPSDQGSRPGAQVREFLLNAVKALTGLAETCAIAVKEEGLEPADKYRAFFAVLDRDAREDVYKRQVYDGHEAPADVHKLTKASVAALAGQGLVAAAKDNYPRDGSTFSYVASFAEVEVDVETGIYHIVDFLASADVGTVIHPRALGGQVLGRSTLGIGHAIGQKWVIDPHYGEMVSMRFHHTKPCLLYTSRCV